MEAVASGTCALLPVTSHDLIAIYQRNGLYNGGWVRDLPLADEDENDDDGDDGDDDPNDSDYDDGDGNYGFEDDEWVD